MSLLEDGPQVDDRVRLRACRREPRDDALQEPAQRVDARALRTMVLRNGVADVQAGAGIVADSVPSAEYQETVNKSLSLLTALAVAEEQLRK